MAGPAPSRSIPWREPRAGSAWPSTAGSTWSTPARSTRPRCRSSCWTGEAPATRSMPRAFFRVSPAIWPLEVANDGADAVTEFEILDGDHILGEVENVAPGLSGHFSLTLKPGRFTMYCPGGKTATVIACLQPDRRVEVEVVGTRTTQ